MKLYRDFTTQAQIDAQYNAGASVGNYMEWMQWYQAKSEEYRNVADYSVSAYGPTVSESLEIYPATSPAAPLVVFIHGGYWRAGKASDFSFVAKGLNAIGCTVAVIDYALCPAVSIDEITRQSRSAVAWLYKNATRYNADPQRITVVGHSAGGQQVAMLLQTDWLADYNLPENLIAAAVPVSGLFDLRPLRYSYLQPMLNLSVETICSQSPLLQEMRKSSARILVTLGGSESKEFLRQSESYVDLASGIGCEIDLWVQDGKHHFDAIEGLYSAESEFIHRMSAIVNG